MNHFDTEEPRRTMNPHAPGFRIMVALVSCVGALLLLPGLAGLSSAASASPSSASTVVWAYGGQWIGQQTGTFVNGTFSGTYSALATFGWEVILTQQNLSGSTFSLNVRWLAAASLNYTACIPNCVSPVATGTLSDHALEIINATSEFSTGTVISGGVAVPAIAITSSVTHLEGNVTEHFAMKSNSFPARDQSRWLAVEARSDARVNFPSGFGLIPQDLSAYPVWSSNASFTANAPWDVGYNTSATGMPTQTTHVVSGVVQGNGTVGLRGSVGGVQTLRNGLTTTAVLLEFTGPFVLLDGAVLVPQFADLFHHTGAGWEQARSGSQLVSLASMDYRAQGVGHLGVLAAAVRYDSSSSASAPVAGAVQTFSVSTANYANSSNIQAQPQSIQTAESQAQCLTAGTCPVLQTGPGPVNTLLRGLVAVGLIIVIGATILALVVARRRQTPPPPHPNARLYPPGAAAGPAPAPPPKTTQEGQATPTESKPDPLDHLW